VYIVKNGDILSTTVLKNTAPPRPLYGINGRLAKVLSLNPSISDMNDITVGQEIILVPFALLTENKLKPVKDKIIEEKVAAANVQDSWSIGLSYGLKYFTLNQSGVLGSPNLAVTVIDALTFSSSYQVNHYSINFDYHSYGLKYETSDIADSKKFSSFDLYGSYNNLLAGIGITSSPLFKNDSGSVSLSSLSLLSLKFGYLSLWTIKSKKSTHLKFRTIFDYYFNRGSDNLDIEISKVSGYSLASSVALSRELMKSSNYQLNFVWPIFFKYQSLKTNLSWGASDGEENSTLLELGTQLGVEVNF
jgi:hypothetical protein